MQRIVRLTGVLAIAWLSQSCATPPPPDAAMTTGATRRVVAERVSAVVVTDRKDLDGWVNRNFATSQAPEDADGGSAAPIAPDGYFLTADHVLSRIAGRNVFLIYGQGGRLAPAKARVVWRSESSDVALLHIPAKTPFYYKWTPADKWLPAGNVVIHGGISTGFKGGHGKLVTPLEPEGAFTRTRKFKMDLPLQPGDSGGPVVDAHGELVGINAAVEFLVPMETAFFVDSEGRRPQHPDDRGNHPERPPPEWRRENPVMGNISSIKAAVGLAVACSALISCGVVESPLIPGSQAAAAKNQVMMVRVAPPSFGYERLVTRCGEFPDLAIFVTKEGVPDFLAEAGTWERPYLILYYLERRGAFVCRTKAENRKAIEFSGPYPVTDKEYRLLHGFQHNAERKRKK